MVDYDEGSAARLLLPIMKPIPSAASRVRPRRWSDVSREGLEALRLKSSYVRDGVGPARTVHSDANPRNGPHTLPAREDLLRASGLDVTYLRPNGLMSNALGWADGIREHNRVVRRSRLAGPRRRSRGRP